MTTPTPLTRLQLQAINKRTLKYPLDIAEKDYYVAAALALLADSPLREVLVFKGGTALHHCYLPQHRFSQDIDFSCRAAGGVSLGEVTAVLEKGGIFEVRKRFVSPATIKIERLRYAGSLGQPGAIKVEIDYYQNVLLPPVDLPYRNAWSLPVELPVMDIRELAAEKLRAASQRARYRDFYDLYLIFEQYEPDLDELVEILRQKEVRQPIRAEGVQRNWQRAAREFDEGADLIHYSRGVPEEVLSQMVESLQFAPILPDRPASE